MCFSFRMLLHAPVSLHHIIHLRLSSHSCQLVTNNRLLLLLDSRLLSLRSSSSFFPVRKSRFFFILRPRSHSSACVFFPDTNNVPARRLGRVVVRTAFHRKRECDETQEHAQREPSVAPFFLPRRIGRRGGRRRRCASRCCSKHPRHHPRGRGGGFSGGGGGGILFVGRFRVLL